MQNQAVLYVTDSPEHPGSVLLDPNSYSADGTVALRDFAVSHDGRFLAYALSDAGSDWQVWHVRDVHSSRDLPDLLKWSKFGGGTWRNDGSGFYYTAYDPPGADTALKDANEYQTLRFHRLGSAQSADQVVYSRRDSGQWFYDATATDDGRYLVISAHLGTDTHSEILVQDLRERSSTLDPILPTADATYDVIDNVGDALIVRTDKNAPRYRVVKIDIADPVATHWTNLIPEGEDTIESVTRVGGELIVQRLHDAHNTVGRYSINGKFLREVPLPALGSTFGFEGHAHDRQTFYTISGYTTPPSVYRLAPTDGATTLVHQPLLAGFDPAQYETRQIFATGKDGTRIPIFVAAAKSVKLDGTNPTVLYGYGGFNVSITPAYAPTIAAWLKLGGVYAIATLRGGGEYGSDWHDAGKVLHKQNVFDDFIAAAQFLNDTHWTSPKRLALRGGSNGGLLIGAVEEQRPDIAAAAVVQVGVLDMIRFREFTVGKAWESDYGSIDDPREFRALYAYSPYHNVRAGVDYPQTPIMTGDHDDRVFPAHSFKFAAALQHADPHGKPILLRVETRAGHGQGTPISKQIEEYVDMYAFVLDAFGVAL